MVSAHDADDDWYEDDEPYGDAGAEWDREPASRPLSLVGRPRLAFEVVAPDSFEVAQTIADRLRAGVPVLVDFRGVDRDLSRPPDGLLQRPGLRGGGHPAARRP